MRKYEKIRTEIKKLSKLQTEAKTLRKPNSGIEQWQAQINVVNNKSFLRHLFQAYAVLKGKERPKVWKNDISEGLIQNMVEKYQPLEVLKMQLINTRIVFHFNKKHLEDPKIPMWVVKCKGETYYVDHLDSKVGFSTKETPENNHTKGSLQFKGSLEIVEENNKKTAIIT